MERFRNNGFLNKIGGKSCQIWIPENLDLLTWISSENRLSFIFGHLGAVWPLSKLFYGMVNLRIITQGGERLEPRRVSVHAVSLS